MRLLTPLFILLLIVAAPALAQPADGGPCCAGPAFCQTGCGAGPGFGAAGWGGGPGGGGHAHGFDGPGPHRDGPPRKMVEGFHLFKLTEFLELSEDQTAKIYPRIAELNKLHDEHRDEMQDKMKELRDLLDDEKNGEAAKLALRIHDMRGEFQQLMHKKQGEIMRLLNEEQQAKYVLFERRFERHLEGVAQRFHERRGAPGERPQRGTGPRGR